jgi:hypothetical protein
MSSRVEASRESQPAVTSLTAQTLPEVDTEVALQIGE